MQGKNATPAIDQARLRGLGDQRLRLTIASGKGEMPAFGGLTPAQVDALVVYLQEMAS
jgi:mono/diheme cytochrome c family protein